MSHADAGKLVGVFAGQQKGAGKNEIPCAELIAGHGLRGDRHAGRDPHRQVSLFSHETFDQLIAEGFHLTAPQLSANLFTENINLNAIKPGTRLRVGGTLLEVVESRKPCRSITRIDQRLPKRLYGQCGQLARVLKGGEVRPGDEIVVMKDERQMALEFS